MPIAPGCHVQHLVNRAFQSLLVGSTISRSELGHGSHSVRAEGQLVAQSEVHGRALWRVKPFPRAEGLGQHIMQVIQVAQTLQAQAGGRLLFHGKVFRDCRSIPGPYRLRYDHATISAWEASRSDRALSNCALVCGGQDWRPSMGHSPGRTIGWVVVSYWDT